VVVAAGAAAVAAGAAAAGDAREDLMMTTYMKPLLHRILPIATVIALSAMYAAAADTAQKTFARPEDAIRALVSAAAADDQATLIAILGPGSEDIVTSGDPVEDRNARKRIAAAAKQRTRLETLPSGDVIAHLGADDWPLPIPMVKDGDRWKFDTPAAREEILNRRVGRNELKATATARAYVEAQRAHARLEKDYAQKLRSDPGKRDGLVWDDPTGKHPSPLGPLLAEADAEGYAKQEPGAEPQPYHGYVFRILTAQGPNGPGGAKSYLKDGKMVEGFALVAYPAQHGASGVMTFIVGPQGVVYQKNLGDKTAEVAKGMTAYDPDESWTPVRD
jgi:hypothetical protein